MMLTDETARELLLILRGHDRVDSNRAGRVLYAEFISYLKSRNPWNVRSKFDLDEVVSEVFCKLMSGSDEKVLEAASPRVYLFDMLHHAAMDMWRRNSLPARKLDVLHPDEITALVDTVGGAYAQEQGFARVLIAEILANLPSDEARLLLKSAHGYSSREIASRSKSSAQVDKQIRRARNRARNIVEVGHVSGSKHWSAGSRKEKKEASQSGNIQYFLLFDKDVSGTVKQEFLAALQARLSSEGYRSRVRNLVIDEGIHERARKVAT